MRILDLPRVQKLTATPFFSAMENREAVDRPYYKNVIEIAELLEERSDLA